MRNAALAIGRRLALIIVVVGLAPSLPAFGRDLIVRGPLFAADVSGLGAVLCHWRIYLLVQARTAGCGLARGPVDDVIDEAIVEIDEFILANSSEHPTRATLDNTKRLATEFELSQLPPANPSKMCAGDLVDQLRDWGPDQIRAEVKKLLSIPREPVMNPCL